MCSKCKVARYCGRKCQGKDWEAVHRSECKVFGQISSFEESRLFSNDRSRLILRVILILKKSPEKEHEQVKTLNGPRTFASLCGNGERFSKIPICAVEINFIQCILERVEVKIELHKLKDIFAKVTVHSYRIFDTLRDVGGQGLYIGPSGFDHSCMPNSIPSGYGIIMKIRAMERIDTRIEAPVLSFIDDDLPRAKRQYMLYLAGISCDCIRCLLPCFALDMRLMEKRMEFFAFMDSRDFEQRLVNTMVAHFLNNFAL